MDIKLSTPILQILNNLKQLKPYLVGGCVRDFILGLEPNDYDILINTTKNIADEFFKQTLYVGKNFGVYLYKYENKTYELALPRKDINVKNGYPEKVTFCSIKEDSNRRDFTINALYWKKNKVIDYHNGLDDLENKIIRFIGNPIDRIQEDPLRMLRGLRLAIKINGNIESNSLEAIIQNRFLLGILPVERIMDELRKMFNLNTPKTIDLLIQTKILEIIFPIISKFKEIEQSKEYHPEGNVYKHSILAVKALSVNDFCLGIATLLHDLGKIDTYSYDETTKKISFKSHEKVGSEKIEPLLRDLKCSKDEIQEIKWLVANHMKIIYLPEIRRGKRNKLMLHPLFSKLTELHKCDCLASNNAKSSLEYIKNNMPTERLLPVITGKDLIRIGLSPSPAFSIILNTINGLYHEKLITTYQEALCEASLYLGGE